MDCWVTRSGTAERKNAVFNLKDDADKALFLKLAADADILIESFSPDVTSRLGIDFETLAAINPKLIYCSITGYGEDTEWRDEPGYDALVAAKTGLQYEQRGWPEGALYHMAEREDPFADAAEIDPDWVQGANRDGPLFVASPWPSLGAMFSAITGISGALFAREKSGRGQKVFNFALSRRARLRQRGLAKSGKSRCGRVQYVDHGFGESERPFPVRRREMDSQLGAQSAFHSGGIEG